MPRVVGLLKGFLWSLHNHISDPGFSHDKHLIWLVVVALGAQHSYVVPTVHSCFDLCSKVLAAQERWMTWYPSETCKHRSRAWLAALLKSLRVLQKMLYEVIAHAYSLNCGWSYVFRRAEGTIATPARSVEGSSIDHDMCKLSEAFVCGQTYTSSHRNSLALLVVLGRLLGRRLRSQDESSIFQRHV